MFDNLKKMKKHIPTLALTGLLSVSSFQTVTAAEPEKAVESSVSINSKLMTASKYIDTDAEYFKMTTLEDEWVTILKYVDEFGGDFFDEADVFSEDFSFQKVLEIGGFGQRDSIASSSKKVDNYWKYLSFTEVKSDNGFLSLYGNKEDTWGFRKFAPADADLVYEVDLDLKQCVKTLEAYTEMLKDEEIKQELAKALDKSISPEFVLRQLLNGYHVRTTVVVSLNDSKKMDVEGVKVPNVDLAIRVKGAVWMFDHYEKMIEEEGGEILDKKVDGDLVYYRSKEEIPQLLEGMENMSPVVVVDRKADLIYITLREEYLQKCIKIGESASADNAYDVHNSEMPDNGSLALYVSNGFFQTLWDLYQDEGKKIVEGLSEEVGDEINGQLLDEIDDELLGEIGRGIGDVDKEKVQAVISDFENLYKEKILGVENGFAFSTTKNKEGILSYARTPFPIREISQMYTMYSMSALAAISSPIILRQQKKGRLTVATNNARDIYFSIKDYADDTDGFSPKAADKKASANDVLRVMFEKGYARDESPFYVTGFDGFNSPDGDIEGKEALSTGENIFAYCAGTPIIEWADRPLLIAPLYRAEDGTILADATLFDGKAIVLTADGTVKHLDINDLGEIIYLDENILDKNHRVWKDGDGKTISHPMDIRLPDKAE